MLSVESPLLRAGIKISDTVNIVQKSEACIKLDEQKSKVPIYKEKAGEKKWRFLTEPTILKESNSVCSKAYYKLKEIIETCVLPTPETSLHICEAPGGFVQATTDSFKNLKKWYASSYSNGIEFKNKLLDMNIGEIFLPEKNGNILEKSVRESFTMKVDLVTADGSFLQENHFSIEETNYELFAAQVDVALRCLNKNGTFVCKFFEGMETKTQVLIAILTNCFENVSIIKPKSSKETNSERYVVCRGFEKYIDVIDTPWKTSDAWLEDLQDVTDEIALQQVEKLEKVFQRI